MPGCLALGWWQVTRALSGNTLSWAYVFEWPIFAGYAVFMWWKLTHDQPTGGHVTGPGALDQAGADGRETEAEAATRVREDEELASYNSYLAALNASGKRKHW